MTPADLKAAILARHPNSHFFDRQTMRYFGDRMSNYGVRSVVVKTQFTEAGDWVEAGVETEAWELYRRRPVKHGVRDSAYFRKSTLQQIHCIVE